MNKYKEWSRWEICGILFTSVVLGAWSWLLYWLVEHPKHGLVAPLFYFPLIMGMPGVVLLYVIFTDDRSTLRLLTLWSSYLLIGIAIIWSLLLGSKGTIGVIEHTTAVVVAPLMLAWNTYLTPKDHVEKRLNY